MCELVEDFRLHIQFGLNVLFRVWPSSPREKNTCFGLESMVRTIFKICKHFADNAIFEICVTILRIVITILNADISIYK